MLRRNFLKCLGIGVAAVATGFSTLGKTECLKEGYVPFDTREQIMRIFADQIALDIDAVIFLLAE